MNSKETKERGQALIIIALAMVGLVAIVGLAIDGGAKFSDQRHAQNAADTAALAAALTKVDMIAEAESNPSISTSPEECPPLSGDWLDASDVCAELWNTGQDRALSNGYDNTSSNVDVEIYSPPVSGYYQGNKDYVQVIITSTINTTFMKVIGRNQTTNVVQAVAYAKPGFNLTDGAMIISYDPDPTCPSGPGNGGGSVDVSGSSTLNLYGGGMFINSPTACGYNAPNCPDINITGGAGINSVAVPPIDNIAQKGLPSCTYPPVPENYTADPVVIPDDVNDLWPDVPPECSLTVAWMNANRPPLLLGTNPIDGKDEYLVYPGFYTDFPQSGLVPNNKHIYLASGVYCIDPPMSQDLQWNSAAFLSLNGSTDPSKNKYQDPSNPVYLNFNPSGVTLYIKSGGGFKLNINSPIYLDAITDPASDYQGYLVILEGTHTSIESCEIEGGAYLDMNGLIWAPYCDITINGQSAPTSEINAQIVGWDIKITGNNVINFNYDPSNQVKIKRKVGLMK